jgi:very-short-patch-repair endonuclease
MSRPLRMSTGLAPSVRLQVFYEMLRQRAIVLPVPEYRFDMTRRWRIDFAWPAHRVGLEVDGAIWKAGRHTRGSGWLKDTEKLNRAACLGWRMLRCTPDTLCTSETLDTLAAALVAPELPPAA